MIFESPRSAAVELALSAVWKRTQMISTNLSNQDTPGFKGKKLAFEGMLQNELLNVQNERSMLSKAQKVAKINSVEPVIYDDRALSVRADGNNVNADNEQIELARAQLQYQALRDKVNGHYSNLKYAISGGR